MVLIKNEQDFPVDITELKTAAQTILDTLDYQDFDLGIMLTAPAVMQEYNKKYRDKDKATDIISFPYHEDLVAGERIEPKTDEDKNLGDILICPQYVHEDLERWGKTFQERMKILLVHGICHLLGYDHIEDADYAVMKTKEALLLEKISS